MNEYVVIYEQAEHGGWGAYIPDVLGGVALGSSRDEAAAGIKEAPRAYVEELQERGMNLTAPHCVAGTVDA